MGLKGIINKIFTFGSIVICAWLTCFAFVLAIYVCSLNSIKLSSIPYLTISWSRNVVYQIKKAKSILETISFIASSATDVFFHRGGEVLVIAGTFTFIPVRGILLTIMPQFLIDIFDYILQPIRSAANKEDSLPPLIEDPAYSQLLSTHDVRVDGVHLKGSLVKPESSSSSSSSSSNSSNSSSSSSSSRASPLSGADSTAADGSTTPTTAPGAASPQEPLVFDQVYGVISKELRDRWKRQEREARISLEAAASRRRQTLLPPVRFSSSTSTSKSGASTSRSSNSTSTSSSSTSSSSSTVGDTTGSTTEDTSAAVTTPSTAASTTTAAAVTAAQLSDATVLTTPAKQGAKQRTPGSKDKGKKH